MKILEDAKRDIKRSEEILKQYKTNLRLVKEIDNIELIKEYKESITSLRKNTKRLKELVIELERELQQRN